MRCIFKIISFPVSLVLSLFTTFFKFLLAIGTTILNVLMLFCIFGAIASFLQKETITGIQALVIAFLVSPYGLPMIGATLIAMMEGINKKIRCI